MTLANGRQILAIPGPSVVPDRVLRAMHRASPNIYTGELLEVTASLMPDLKKIAGTKGKVAMYIGNGHAAWEASLSNVIAPGDTVLVPATGSFGHGWGQMASRLGAEVEIVEFGKRNAVDPNQLETAFRADKSHDIKAVLAVHVDTSTSAKSDIAAIRKAMDAAGHPALLLADCIASLGCDPFEMDAWGVDVMVTGCQKGLMSPPGTCFVFFNEKAAQVRAEMDRVSSYWDWVPRADPEDYYQYHCGTAPTHHIYGLREALDMIVHEEGLKSVLARHESLAHAIWAAFDIWGSDGPVELNIADPVDRSHAVTSVRIGSPAGTQLRDWLTENAGVTLGIGLGMALPSDPNWHGFFRVGHMGHVNAHMALGTLASIDAGLKALEIPHGSGALEAAATICAETSAAQITALNSAGCCG